MKIRLAPPSQTSNPQEQVKSLYSYLYRMTEQLNVALNSLTSDNFAESEKEALQVSGTTGMTGKAEATVGKTADALKALIIKTADSIQAEMEALQLSFEGDYVANSTFGTYKEQVSNDITAGATAVVQSYDFASQLTALGDLINGVQSDADALGSYNVTTSQYIKTGLLYFDDGIIPRYGVAVGENLTTVEVNGETVIERAGLAATFTSDRLSFWQNSVEVAYISNNTLFIREATILTNLNIGNWVIDTSYGFALRWAGEE